MPLTGHGAGARAGLLVMALFGGGCGKTDGPPPDIVDTDALRAMVSACLGLDAASSAWFFWDARFGGVGPADATRRCVEAAADCRAVLGCAGLSDEPCDGEERCDGTVAVSCLDISASFGRKQYRDCAGDTSGNTTCSMLDDPKEGLWATCHAAACTASHCDGDVYVDCRDGVELRRDCRETAETCLTTGEYTFCGYRDACARNHCRGDEIELCFGGHVQFEANCNTLVAGSTCREAGSATECAAPHPHPDCKDSSDFGSWCEGGVAMTCLTGVRVQVACDALPGGRCEPIGGTGAVAKAKCVVDGWAAR
jgi:hypothetical protein